MAKSALDVGSLLGMSVSDIAGLIYEKSESISFGSKEPSDDEKVDRGFALFWDFIEPYRNVLCSNEFIVKAGASDRTQLVAAIIDVFVGAKGGPPVVAVAVLAVKIGLGVVCNEKGR